MTLAAGGIVDVADITNLGITKVQMGTYTATITSSTFVATVVNFPEAFATTPRVFPVCRTASGAAVGSFFQITSLSNTSVTIRWGIPVSGSASCSVDWVAVA